MALRAVDLFCGAGGLSLGLAWAGIDIVAGVDNDPHAMRTFAANHPHAAAITGDIREMSSKDIASGPVDLVAGGPCCQGFSTHGKRWADDPRNFLFVEFLRLVEEFEPRYVLMENVRGLLLSRGGAFHHEILRSFADLGYSIEGRVLNAADYGVPQLRHRLVYLGHRTGEAAPQFPLASHFPAGTIAGSTGDAYRTVRDAIGDLPLLGEEKLEEPIAYGRLPDTDYQRLMRDSAGTVVFNHSAKRVSANAMRIIKKIAPGHGLRSLPPKQLPERFQRMRTIANGKLRRDCTTLYHRLAWDRPAYTITCYFRNVSAGPFVHPVDNRALTPREAARIQSFPDTFRFEGASIPRQIGNAVPPLLARSLGQELVHASREPIAHAA